MVVVIAGVWLVVPTGIFGVAGSTAGAIVGLVSVRTVGASGEAEGGADSGCLWITKDGIGKPRSSWGGSCADWRGFRIDAVGVRDRWGMGGGVCGMDVEGARRLTRDVTGAVVGGMGEGGGGGTVVVAVSRLNWLVGGDVRRILIVVEFGVVCRTIGRTVLLLLLLLSCCGVTTGTLFNSDGFCRARLFLSAAMLAGLEM